MANTGGGMSDAQPRLAELVGALSLATDLAAGLAYETALRTSLLAVRLGRTLGVQGEALRDIYYTGLLRFIGCTAFAHETAARFGGDDMALLGALTPADTASPMSILVTAVRRVEAGRPPLRRAATVARLMVDPAFGGRLAAAHCDLAVGLAGRLGMRPPVVASLGQIYERYDGKGAPRGLRGSGIGLPARLLHVAFRAETQRGLFGPAEAVAVVAQRSNGELDPDVARAFVRNAPALLEQADAPSVWELFLAAEPAPFVRIEPARVGEIASAFAHYADVKSPYTLGHSVGVARLAARAGGAAGLSEAGCESLHVAGLLHDLGRISVPNGIWDKPGPLNTVEWERVRLHPYQTERILAQSPLLAPFAPLAGLHHERSDGSGYHRGISGAAISRPARILAASDAYHAMTEPRPHRPARDPAEAARALAAEARAGRLDQAAVEAVLTAAGQRRASRERGTRPATLSEREVEVLCLLARGLPNKAIAERLVLSPRTVKNHVAHIYEKTGISTRAAAAVFAVTNDLLEDGPDGP
jgi:HD-GYP domain-containing protein (c-di-GMP phosphodiesterase class II)